jgi:L-2,4-diaminobutyric acid acetyltransferase
MSADDAPFWEGPVRVEKPCIDDGVQMHRLAAESKVLDVNSRYAYLLWCRDFAATSVVAKLADDVAGFITGYRRAQEPGTLLIWQVAVSERARGRGLAGRMLDAVFDQAAELAPLDHLETTITPDNDASIALFTAFARRRGANISSAELFSSAQLGAGHQPEHRYRIGPIGGPVSGRTAELASRAHVTTL